MLRAGIDDWGGVSPVTADHVNPERPWPAIEELAARSAEAGFVLRERLTAYPTLRPGRVAVDRLPAARPRRRARRAGRARPTRTPRSSGRPWQEPDGGFASTGRTDLHTADRHRGPHRGPPRRLLRGLRRLGRPGRGAGRAPARARRCAWTPTCAPGSSSPRPDPAALLDPAHHDAAMALVLADGPGAGGAGPPGRRRAPRRRRRRGHLRRQPQHQLLERLLRRLPVLRVRPARARRRRVPPLARRGRRPAPWRRPATARRRSACRAASTRSCPSPSTPTSSAR